MFQTNVRMKRILCPVQFSRLFTAFETKKQKMLFLVFRSWSIFWKVKSGSELLPRDRLR
jgi:hypothetical protein